MGTTLQTAPRRGGTGMATRGGALALGLAALVLAALLSLAVGAGSDPAGRGARRAPPRRRQPERRDRARPAGAAHPDGDRGRRVAGAWRGRIYEALTRNPLADPGLLGVNAGASAAVVIALGVLGDRRDDRLRLVRVPGCGAGLGRRLRDRLDPASQSEIVPIRLIISAPSFVSRPDRRSRPRAPIKAVSVVPAQNGVCT